MRFSSLNPTAVRSKLNFIIDKEKIKINDDALDTLIDLEPYFRQLLNLLQGIHFLYDAMGKTITKDDVYKYLYKPR